MYDNNADIFGFIYNGTEYFYVKNAQNDVVAITDSTGKVIANYYYDDWGKLIETTGNTEIANLNPIRYRSYYYDSEIEFYWLQSRCYDPEVGRFISEDRYIKTPTGSLLSTNMFAYCENNPVNKFDPTGGGALTAVATVTLGGIALWKLGLAAIGTIAAGALVYVAADTLVKNPPIMPTYSLPKVDAKPKVDSREKDLAPAIPKKSQKETTIYRYYSSKTENLAPRIGKDYDGLSFSTKPPKPGIHAVVTTIEQVNATGILLAIRTGGSHVTVIPTNGSVIQWMEQGQSSMWTETLSGIVVEWDGGN